MIKITKEQWEQISKNKYAFLPLSKGIGSGEHTFVSEEVYHSLGQRGTVSNKKYGTAKLEPKLINPRMVKHTICQNEPCDNDGEYCHCEEPDFKEIDWAFVSREEEEQYGLLDEDDFQAFYESVGVNIDKETYKYVVENYVKKGIDFIVYEVKNAKGE